MASVQSVVIDKIDAVVVAAADVVLRDLQAADDLYSREMAMRMFRDFASAFGILTGVFVSEPTPEKPASFEVS